MQSDIEQYKSALAEAQAGYAQGGIPIGAALFRDGALLGSGHNLRVQNGDPTAHGEISALRNVGRVDDYRGTVLHTTYRPCPMCTGSVLLFGIPRVVVGQSRTFPGGKLPESEPPTIELLRSRGVEVVVLDDDETAALMQAYTENNLEEWHRDDGQRG
jgi:cytosine/creatinine deaminase